MKRFFGIHFDFHAMPGETVPELWRPETYEAMLDVVRPDYVQCDTKGHAGLSSYPTKAGTRADLAPGIDILRTMRNATAKRNIPLFGHHSGIYDRQVVADHPDWAVIRADGTRSEECVSVFSPYVTEILIPQLRELAGEYGLDGAWIDGDCWKAEVDYSPQAVAAWEKRHDTPPPRPEDPGYEEYREFCRAGFRDYVRCYVDAMHAEFPGFLITSNWIFSALTPEKTDVAVDFLSGDYSCENAIESARFHGRCLEARNLPWDLMAWGQHAIPLSWMTRNRSTKPAVQYCQEAAVILAMGGGFEFFNIHYGCGGVIQTWALPIWRRTAEFCREREELFDARIVPELGVVLPADRNASGEPNLFGTPGFEAVNQWINALQDCQYSVKVVLESEMTPETLRCFRAIVLPGTRRLPERARGMLADYAANGGILLMENESAPQFSAEFGRSFAPSEQRLIYVEADGALAGGEASFTPLAGEGVFGTIRMENFCEREPFPAGCARRCGKGVLATLAFGFAAFHAENRTGTLRRFLRKTLTDLGYRPSIRVEGSRFADLTVTERNGTRYVSLLNVAGEHNVKPVRGYDEIPPIGPLKVIFAPELAVRHVRTLPGNRELPLVREPDGGTSVTVESLHIHLALIHTA